MAKTYLYVQQSCISRWQYDSDEKTTQNIGLYTDRFSSCIIIVLRGEISQRLVMMHADSQITLGDLKREISWVGENCEKYIYYKEHPEAEETIDDLFMKDNLRKAFSFKMVKVLRKNGQIIPDFSLPMLPDGSRVPEFEATTIYANINDNITSYYELPDTRYIKNILEIEQIYQNFQNKNWQTYANQHGSKRNWLYESLKTHEQNNSLVPPDVQQEDFSKSINTEKSEKEKGFSFMKGAFNKSKSSGQKALPDSQITSETKERLRAAVIRIVPYDWKVIPSINKIWLQLSNEETAQAIISHFKKNGYDAIKLEHRKDAPTIPIIILENANYNLLQKIPPMQVSVQQEKDRLGEFMKFQKQ